MDSFKTKCCWRTSTAIECGHLPRFCVKIERETIAANATGPRFGHIHDGGRCYRRIRRVTALAKDIEARLRRQWLTGRHHPTPRDYRRPSRIKLHLPASLALTLA
jgi:hypothetical protein